jgi:hypothetical protein
MTRRVSASRVGALLGVVMAGGWIAARHFSATEARSSPPPGSPTLAALDSATVVVRGSLTAAARQRLAPSASSRGAILVILDSADVRVCEDLGRQLRVLRGRTGPALPLVVTAAPAALPTIRAFAHREHLRPAALIDLRAEELFVGYDKVPTPAAVVVYAGEWSFAGVAHPSRFRNIRIRSFADELSADLPDGLGDPSPP